ncbi:MAG TPA: VOC family protein [Conexibacter sp.]|jgi:catechol 2,3-dioxygenase|nr:VOC family protein [Conexibacter sp.]
MSALSPSLALGPLRLTVADIDGTAAFYERVVGLRRRGEADDGAARLGLSSADGLALVELIADAAAPTRARGSSGLFHLALLVPDRRALAEALRRVAAAGWRLDGASDHLVSEALYLSDPEGNGIELYRDRPRNEWRRAENGELAMATLPLDLDDLLGELADGTERRADVRALLAAVPAEDPGMPAGTTLGHVHLQVSDLAAAEAFYAGALGLDVMVRSYPGALFVAADGYHHHLGLNTWASAGGPPADPASRGLRDFAIRFASADERERVTNRVAEAGFALREERDAAVATDPFGISVRLMTGV